MTTTQLSKQDYLKKYLSDGDKKKKKKKKVTQNSIIKSKIIDDDIDLKNMKAIDSDELEIYDLGEEAPQIVGIVDDRPEEVRMMSEFRSSKKWKIVADEFGIDEVQVTAIGEEKHSNDAIEEKQRENGSHKADSIEFNKEKGNSGGKKVEEDTSRKRQNDSDESPLRKIKVEKSDSDASPPRKSKKHYDSDNFPPRKHKKKKQSPPVKIKKEKSDSDASPPRRNRKDMLPRKIKKEKSDSDASPPRKSRGNYDSDQSPPRRIKKEKQDTSRKKYDSDVSPTGKTRRNQSDSDSSPPRNSRKQKEIFTSKRKESRNSRISDEKSERKESGKVCSKSSDGSSVTKKKDGSSSRENLNLKNTLGGKKSGLQNAEELRKEIEELKEREREMKASASGNNEAVVVRDRKTGKRIDPKEEARKKREREEKEAEKVAQYAVWGKGIKQVQDDQDKLKDDLYEMSKPFARYADDKDLDDMLKNKEWDGDPMLEYMRKKKKKEREESGDDKPQYEGAYEPNRYGIRPGYRWDGVDRSNGYEKKWFEEQNAKKAREEEAFKWSTADM